MKKIFLPGLAAGIAMLIVGWIVNMLFGFIFPSLMLEYTNTAIFRAWSDPLMSLFFAYPIIVGFIIAWAWDSVKKLFKGSAAKRGTHFGMSIWLIANVPGMIMSISSFQLSYLMVFTWLVGGFVQLIIGGMVLARMNK